MLSVEIMAYIVLDFGGSLVKGAIVEPSRDSRHAPKIVQRFSVPSRVTSFSLWFDLFDPIFAQFEREYSINGIAISACGAVDVEQGLVFGGSLLRYILDVNVKALFTERYHLPVEVENDACCAALCEYRYGQNYDSDHLCLVVIGSGVGGAVIADGKLVKGHHLYTGEFGYSILGFENGAPQIMSELASTRGLIKQAAKALKLPKSELDGKKVFELYRTGDETALNVVQCWIGYLATALFNLQYTVDPGVIILGGAISQQPLLIPLLNAELEKYRQAMPYCHIVPKVVAAKYGNDANLIGAVEHFQLMRQG
ncbi:ROK family protein [Vibrio ponticus]|nr:ROK family protein [Vibrio ponticus]